MSRINAVNESFSDLYKKLGKFSYSPYGWEIASKKSDDNLRRLLKIYLELPIKIVLTPILLPLTAITFSLAAIRALLTAAVHLLALSVAAVADCFDPKPFSSALN